MFSCDWEEIKPLLVNLEENKTYVVMLEILPAAVRQAWGQCSDWARHIIHDQVEIGDNAVIMMGAVINIGAEIGAGTMIDMGATFWVVSIVGKQPRGCWDYFLPVSLSLPAESCQWGG